jgi:hypothetical protein
MAFTEKLFQVLRSRGTITIASLLSTGSYVSYKDKSRYWMMEKSFSRGNILAPLADNSYETRYYPRKDVENKLRQVLTPEFTNEYYLVSGGVGSGKTRTIVEMVRQMMLDRGAKQMGAPIYVHVAQGKSFPDALASAVNFFFDEHLKLQFFVNVALRIDSFPKRDQHQKLRRVLDALEKSAFEYLQKTGRPVVLVIDGVSSLSGHMEGAIELMQEKAKLWADTNIIKVVFVSNDECTEQTMQQHSSNWSRAAPPIYIGDMTKTDTVEYLRDPDVLESDHRKPNKKTPMTVDEANRIYDLVGGRVHHLIAFKRDWAMSIAFDITATEIGNKEREKFLNVSKSTAILKAVDIIKRSDGKGIALAKLVSVCSEKDVATMIKYDIIRIERRITGMVVVFESRLTENVARFVDQ